MLKNKVSFSCSVNAVPWLSLYIKSTIMEKHSETFMFLSLNAEEFCRTISLRVLKRSNKRC